jgi:ERCC4-related helicase
MAVLEEKHLANLWKADAPELREYQESIYRRAINENVLVVIPTGLGKTFIAAKLGAFFIEQGKLKKKVIFLAPTRPLIDQHIKSHRKIINLENIGFCILSGKIPPAKRAKAYVDPKAFFFFMTPQTLNNDLKNQICSLDDISLIIFDEAHHARGEYAYCNIAKMYVDQNPEGRILGLTASPGATEEKRNEVLENLFIPKKNIEFRDKTHSEVKRYTFETQVMHIGVDMTESMEHIHEVFTYMKEQTLYQYIEFLTGYNPKASTNIRNYTQGFCIKQQKKYAALLKTDPEHTRQLRILLSINARAIKLYHLLTSLEAQGLNVVLKYLKSTAKKIEKTTASKADLFLFNDSRIKQIYKYLMDMADNQPEDLIHPKMGKLRNVILSQFEDDPNSRILIFTKFRATVSVITNYLKKIPPLIPHKFIGQASKGKDKGMNQKKQIATLESFKDGEINVLVATNVAEEGLDIAECNMVMFYDNSASEIRLIQRMGRTGRSADGKVIILYTKGTSDEFCVKISQIKKRKMKRELIGEKTTLLKKDYVKLNPAKIKKPKATHSKIKYTKQLFEESEEETLEAPNCSDELSNESPGMKYVQITPQIEQDYGLSTAFPIYYSAKAKQGLFNIAYPATTPNLYQIGIIFMDAIKFSSNITNYSFHQDLLRKKKKTVRMLVFIDAQTLSSDKLRLIGTNCQKIREFTQISFVIFTSIEILHQKLRNIFKHL